MFQSFDDHGGPEAGAGRLRDLRAELARQGLTGFIVPHADEHQSEYLPPSAERLAWLTGFTGSAGLAVVLRDRAALFVDGRYTLQAGTEADTTAFEIVHLIDSPPSKWLPSKLSAEDRVGYDPWLMTVGEVRRLTEALKASGAALVPVRENPIDRLWTGRPPAPQGAVSLHPLDLAGQESSEKIEGIRKSLAEKPADAVILTQADSIAWALNIRGADIAHNPVPLALAVVPRAGKPKLFIDGRKLSNAVRAYLAEIVEIDAPENFDRTLGDLGRAGRQILLHPQSAAEAIRKLLADAGATVVEGADPVGLPRARKNPVELAGSRRAHVRDGAAMVRFLAWLDRSAPGDGPDQGIDEIAAAAKLEATRAETAKRDGAELADISFDTIAGAGPNGAIVHYRVTRKTSRRLDAGTLFLVDSGGQYRDGTTDITRTVAIGAPTAEMRDRFTRVLKGHIAVATARFPAGTNGAQLDGFARAALWQAGLDYDHGTGHGVGSFLSVHEGPQRISKIGSVALEPGMIVSNEPGFYKTGAFGIRIESLVAVMPAEPIEGGERPMLSFETLSLCPIDRRLIEPALLTAVEIAWLDAYHARLAPALDRLLDATEREWLAAAAKPLKSFSV